MSSCFVGVIGRVTQTPAIPAGAQQAQFNTAAPRRSHKGEDGDFTARYREP